MKKIPLTQGYEVIIDDIDEDLKKYKWCAQKTCGRVYAARRESSTGKYIYMHRVILERKLERRLLPNEHVDHIKGIGLDNHRKNLRQATRTQNNRNKRMSRNNASGYKGVTWHKLLKKWHVEITVNRKHIHIGSFSNLIEAAKAYDEAAKKYHGEFARLNFP